MKARTPKATNFRHVSDAKLIKLADKVMTELARREHFFVVKGYRPLLKRIKP